MQFDVGNGVGKGEMVSLLEAPIILGAQGVRASIMRNRVPIPLTGYTAMVGPIIKWTQQWVIYLLISANEGLLSHYASAVYLVVPIKWARLGFIGRIQHWCISHYLSDEDPPRYHLWPQQQLTVLQIPATSPSMPTELDIGIFGWAAINYATQNGFQVWSYICWPFGEQII